MPINPNIALGVQPQPQPVNMLGQLGQLYALKAARQEVEGGEAVRDFFSQGGDLSTPEGQRQIMTAAPKLGGQLIKQQADIRKTQIDTLKDEIGLRRDALSNVRTPEEYLAWHDANHTGQLGAFFKSAGINPSRESIMAELAKPGGLDKLVRASSLGATRLQQELMQTERSVQVANIGAGPGHRQADIAAAKFDLEKRQQDELVRLMRNEPPTGTPAPTAGPTAATPVGAGSVPTGASAPTAAPATAPTNALAPTAAPSVNALAPKADPYAEIKAIDAKISQLMNSGNPKALASAQALTVQRNALLQSAKQQFGGNLVDVMIPDPNDPKKTITIKGRQDQYGRVVPAEMVSPPLSTDASATGATTISPSVVRAPLTPAQEKQIETARVKEEGQKTVDTVLSTLNRQYQGLVNEGGITDTSKSAISNLRTSATTNVAGQMIGGAVGSKAQQFRDSIEQTRPLLLNAIKNATGMSAQQLNSNVELQTYLKAATDPKLSIQANVEAMNNISKLFGLGEEFKIAPPVKKGSSAPATEPSVKLPKGFKLD
jgi:hypothetical protein